MGSGLKSKKKNKWMPQYMATEEQIKHRDYCIKNDIRISPNIYDKDTIWIEYYRMCKYYYDKHTR